MDEETPRRGSRVRKQKTFDDHVTNLSMAKSPFPSPTPNSSLTTQPPKRKKPASEVNKEYRARIKADPERYNKYREENAQKCKQYRQTADAATREKWRVQSTVRSAKKRQRDKENKATQLPKPRTRKDEENETLRKAKDAQRKREKRASRTPQQIRRDNERRRKQRKEKGLAAQNSQVRDCAEAETVPCDTRSPGAQRQALARVRRQMSQQPAVYAKTVCDLINKASPRKKLAMEKCGVAQKGDEETQEVGNLLLTVAHELRNKKDKDSCAKRSLLLESLQNLSGQRKKSRVLGISRKAIAESEKEKEKKKKKRTEEIQQDVAKFFSRTAVPLPNKKHVSKKTGMGASVVQLPLRELHADYKAQGGMAAFSTFAKCRPKHVRTMLKSHLRQCLCEYCANVEQKLKTVNRVCMQHNCQIKHVYHAVQLSVCEGHKKDCAYRKCPDCGISGLRDHLAPILSHREELQWHRWTSKKVRIGGSEVSRKVLETRQGNARQVVEELCQEVVFLSEHLFRANWQQQQFNTLRTTEPFPPRTVAMVMDFSENYTCLYQDEVQAAHWHHNQVTIHPLVCYYPCQRCPGTVHESLVFISSDLTHDHHAVQHFVAMAIDHLRNQRHLDLMCMIQWSDRCTGQYKSKGPFTDISFGSEEFSLATERHYFGSRHGKGPSDGESAVVKHHVASAVKAGRGTIGNAEDFFRYCTSSSLNKQPQPGECQHFLRSFLLVAVGDIVRQRPGRDVKTIHGTRDFHHVRAGHVAGTIIARHLSCFCVSCLSGEGVCANIEVVGEQLEHSLVPNNERRQQRTQRQRDAHTPPPASLVQDLAVNAAQCVPPEPAAEPEPATPLSQPSSLPGAVPLPLSATLPSVSGADPASRRFVKGMWVKALFPVGKRTETYIGKILDTDIRKEECKLQCLRARGTYFAWPVVEDVSWVSFTQIVCVLDNPDITLRDQYIFKH